MEKKKNWQVRECEREGGRTRKAYRTWSSIDRTTTKNMALEDDGCSKDVKKERECLCAWTRSGAFAFRKGGEWKLTNRFSGLSLRSLQFHRISLLFFRQFKHVAWEQKETWTFLTTLFSSHPISFHSSPLVTPFLLSCLLHAAIHHDGIENWLTYTTLHENMRRLNREWEAAKNERHLWQDTQTKPSPPGLFSNKRFSTKSCFLLFILSFQQNEYRRFMRMPLSCRIISFRTESYRMCGIDHWSRHSWWT